MFNVSWYACMAQTQRPQTCGDLRSQAAAGAQTVAGFGSANDAAEFTGNQASSQWTLPAAAYNNLWQQWGLGLFATRPANFDQMVAERYGVPLPPPGVSNPYPLPGEDPNQTHGGSGTLPMALTQLHNADGSWSGNVGITCAVCHGGQVGSAADGPGLGPLLGRNGLADLDVLLTEFANTGLANGTPNGNTGFYLFGLNRVRGSGDITNFQMFGLLTLFDPQSLPSLLNPGLWLSGTSGSENPPSWWNLGHRPAKFYDAGMSADSARIELSWYMPYAATPQYQQGFDWVESHVSSSNTWLLSVQSPSYPFPINTALAEQGSVLFHTLNLWDPSRNNPVPPPPGYGSGNGNGSCASCHGAYAPYYANNTAFLSDSTLAGMAGYVTPINIINTDPARFNANTLAIKAQFQNNYFGYPGQTGCAEQFEGTGYLAPPLYGVWAEAPYFHNGSVPSVWDVLKSSDRPALWERVSKPPQTGFVMGYQTDLSAYDQTNLGWQFATLQCDPTGLLSPYLACNPADPENTVLVQSLLTTLFNPVYANGSILWNVLSELTAPTFTNADIENRKIYNTHMYSQSNSGHAFTDVLTDQERAAIIEYLKTL
ncbi:hypothetical protein [Dyella sp. 2HG41-7]|uniref:c-type cytochrome n=1 Tax=Dyella sp. 2HG41-7 TaxID=2883239 RepID=UPI001F24E4AF|nr:hypothetical protein [Dyella sp. 2HG41-7]